MKNPNILTRHDVRGNNNKLATDVYNEQFNTCWMFFVRDSNGNEALLTAPDENGFPLPMMAKDEVKLAAFKSISQKIADDLGLTVCCKRFSSDGKVDLYMPAT